MESESFLMHSQESTTDPFLSQISPVHAIPTKVFKIHFNIIFPSTLSLPSKPQISRNRKFLKFLPLEAGMFSNLKLCHVLTSLTDFV